MVDVNDAVIARLKKGGETFEILVDCEKALEFRDGKVGLDEVLATEDVFTDVKQGKHASEADMRHIFLTSNPREVASVIIREGEISLTAELRNRMREEKRKKLVDLIHRNAVDSKTGFPHPPQRIEQAMDDARVKIDDDVGAEEQLYDVVSSLREILPIRLEKREISVTVPAAYAGKAYGSLKALGKFVRDEWLSDGSLVIVLEIPAGIQEDVENAARKLSDGESEIRILNKI